MNEQDKYCPTCKGYQTNALYDHDWKRYPRVCHCDPDRNDTMSTSEIKSVLKLLLRYYSDRAKVATSMVIGSADAQSASQHVLSAMRWEAKAESILTVAENLELELEESEGQG